MSQTVRFAVSLRLRLIDLAFAIALIYRFIILMVQEILVILLFGILIFGTKQ